jgi:hypothetical protein
MIEAVVVTFLFGSPVVRNGCCCRYCRKPTTSSSPQQLCHMPPLLVGKRNAARMAVARALDRRVCARKSVTQEPRDRNAPMDRYAVCVAMRETCKLGQGHGM